MAKRTHLVCQQLENIARDALEKYQDVIRQYIKGRNGIYALYREDRLYYVGLATNLRSRLKQHLKDRHGQAWDRFSVYLTLGNSHLRELESLLLRIVRPVGNRHRGRFGRCEDMRRRFARDIKSLQNEERLAIFGMARDAAPGPHDTNGHTGPILAIYRNRPKHLRARYKGMVYRATVRKDGAIRYKKKVYNSPSLAAAAVVGRNQNGWAFWQYQRSPGEWVRLGQLRT